MVSKQDAKDRTYSIFDVVLPMFAEGRRVVLPRNRMGKWLKKRMKVIYAWASIRYDWCRDQVENIMHTMKVVEIEEVDSCCVSVDQEDCEDEMQTRPSKATRIKTFTEICKFRHVVVRPQCMRSSVRRYSRWATIGSSSSLIWLSFNSVDDAIFRGLSEDLMSVNPLLTRNHEWPLELQEWRRRRFYCTCLELHASCGMLRNHGPPGDHEDRNVTPLSLLGLQMLLLTCSWCFSKFFGRSAIPRTAGLVR